VVTTTTTEATTTTAEAAQVPTFVTSRVTQPRVEFAPAPSQGRDPIATIAIALIVANAVLIVAAVIWRRRHPRPAVAVAAPPVPRALPPAPVAAALPVRVPARVASPDQPRAAIVFEPAEHLGWPVAPAGAPTATAANGNGNGSADGDSPGDAPGEGNGQPVGATDEDIMRIAQPAVRSNL
jgi:hypothetical protein